MTPDEVETMVRSNGSGWLNPEQAAALRDIKLCQKCGKEAWRQALGMIGRDERREVRTQVWYQCRDTSCGHVWREFRARPNQYGF
jgi:hypothetical protein